MKKTHVGSCHCGVVRFQVETDLDEPGKATRCNCTICMKTMITGSSVKPAAFKVLAGEEHLSSYEWGMKVGKRFFCKHCGVQCFGTGSLEELGGDFVSVNLNAMDDIDVNFLKLIHWDGRHNNWQAGPREQPWPITLPTRSGAGQEMDLA